MKVRVGEAIKAGTVLTLLPSGEVGVFDASRPKPSAQFIAGRDLVEGELIDTDTPEAGAALIAMGFIATMTAGEDIEEGQSVYLRADGKVGPERTLPREVEDGIRLYALAAGLNPESVMRLVENLLLLKILGLAKPDER